MKFKEIYNENFENSENISKEQKKTANNNEKIIIANQKFTLFNKIKDISTEWENVDFFVDEDNITQNLYKQWEMELFAFPESEEVDEVFLKRLLPSIKCEIEWKNPTSLDINFYNTGFEMNTMKFYEIRGKKLLLKYSIYIEKYFGSQDLTVPQVKLHVKIMPMLTSIG